MCAVCITRSYGFSQERESCVALASVCRSMAIRSRFRQYSGYGGTIVWERTIEGMRFMTFNSVTKCR
jgi:hypothetical protein